MESLEDLYKHVPNDFDHLVVMVVKTHLHVQANELRQMTMCVGVFRTEHWNRGQNRWLSAWLQ